jgi:hypothetical protein
MQVETGWSSRADAVGAVAEATERFRQRAPTFALAFCSTAQDPQEIARALSTRLDTPFIVGCTTAGEHVDDKHLRGSLVVASVTSPKLRVARAEVRGLGSFDETRARRTADELLATLGEGSEARRFCLAFFDGLSRKEEVIASTMADALEGIPLVGGSAGDDLRFARTCVFSGGEALSDAAVFLAVDSAHPFELIKHQHYTTTERSLVITRADVEERRVYEIDGRPALEGYARALGLPIEKIDADVTFMNPLTFKCDGELYVRSIQRTEPDGSILFYCAIEEGMVLSVGGHVDMGAQLDADLESVRDAELFIASNCILRALEAQRRGIEADLATRLARRARHVIGFDTYGEQLHGMHINQTLVGVALRSGGLS